MAKPLIVEERDSTVEGQIDLCFANLICLRWCAIQLDNFHEI